MAKIVVELAAHAKSSTLYGRSYGRTVVQPIFSAQWVTTIPYNYGATLRVPLLFCIMGLRCARCELRFYVLDEESPINVIKS